MTKRMLIDATHAEETRVVVLDGNRLEDFDVETSTKKQLKGNIYLAKVVRVEPSLQAAFVDYGGNRHGFLAFSEIHPDYYQIPIADRQRLLEMQAEEARREEEEEDRAALQAAATEPVSDAVAEAEHTSESEHITEASEQPAVQAETAASDQAEPPPEIGTSAEPVDSAPPQIENRVEVEQPYVEERAEPAQPLIIESDVISAPLESMAPDPEPRTETSAEPEPAASFEPSAGDDQPTAVVEPAVEVIEATPEVESFEHVTATEPAENDGEAETIDAIPETPPPETIGGEGDGSDDARDRRIPPRFLRNYKIQEVIKRRQILLVQVVKEERGTKGAALTTYLSLAGRYGVLMPNSPRGGGISRKITSATDRRRLKEIMAELEIPQGMGLIVRTAGANRPKAEIKRDCEYLLRLWDDIREHTLKSVAPALIYEEASLIKRAIRDVYSRDIDDIVVDGEEGWRAAHEFMRMLMPSHAKKVQLWRNGGQPLFAKHQVEAQLDSMLLPIVQLRSGGYLVINQAEALVAIDVNSGRSTRERGIEETALRTNLEAADEVARQLRLRDLAGLIVIDFIDMELKKHNSMVERRLKEALKNDRARIQVGHISHFGLLEMSRQRLRPSLAETSFIACPHCGGTGHVRSTESGAIHVLRGIEEEGAKRRAAEIVVYVSTPIALYMLNHKRERLREIELRYAMHVVIAGDDTQIAPLYRIDRVRPQVAIEPSHAITPDVQQAASFESEAEDEEVTAGDEEAEDETGEATQAAAGETAEDENRRRRRRRRRRGGRREDAGPTPTAQPSSEAEVSDAEAAETHVEGVPEHADSVGNESGAPPDESSGGRFRRNNRRGGRRRRFDFNEGEMPPHAAPGADQPDLPPLYTGPTPANPFGGHTFDIFDVLEKAEEAAAAAPASTASMEPPPESAAAPAPEPAGDSAPIIADEPLPEQAEATGAEPAPETVVTEPTQEVVATETTSMAAAPEPQVEPEPEQPVPANDAAPEPAVKPIIIGSEQDVVVEKKRGWWRR